MLRNVDRLVLLVISSNGCFIWCRQNVFSGVLKWILLLIWYFWCRQLFMVLFGSRWMRNCRWFCGFGWLVKEQVCWQLLLGICRCVYWLGRKFSWWFVVLVLRWSSVVFLESRCSLCIMLLCVWVVVVWQRVEVKLKQKVVLECIWVWQVSILCCFRLVVERVFLLVQFRLQLFVLQWFMQVLQIFLWQFSGRLMLWCRVVLRSRLLWLMGRNRVLLLVKLRVIL